MTDKTLLDDVMADLKDKKKICRTCPFNQYGNCKKITNKRMPVDKVNYCSFWFKEG